MVIIYNKQAGAQYKSIIFLELYIFSKRKRVTPVGSVAQFHNKILIFKVSNHLTAL